ncbi:NADH-ubiquinone oxidoreductase-F iron-sulfur binding region domain-containing protein [Natranaerofaba carboxydovora]|uniref:NADH-ubiquinone oxidoreductase-F iron-sulfur binding region domain-containing protein n=1 Tax=Natranaerofaba carboxydovora TaxID=2742683 RepID=UPI001F1415B3|nr:NADH-ubiquinone oxidoreductase-F iron-sulfur binding region domain-containing protein [Natranaerofaba carboxydovora]UMZ73587.1 NADP-reducing hydrogenase subunit HndC [Natranaerofaba carboxydovora]
MKKKVISICCGTGCNASGAGTLFSNLKKKLNNIKDIETEITVKNTGCHGFCEQGPVMVIKPDNIFYRQVRPEDADTIIEKSIKRNEIIEELLYEDPTTGKKIVKEEDIPFYQSQQRLLFGYNGDINPRDINDYIATGGYEALKKVFENMNQEDVIKEVKDSKLRGRGGGGFPTGKKWEAAFLTEEQDKYIICNADEGDPGCFQDRSLIEGNPHLVLEGMIIGAYAVGASKGYIYVRHEYPLAVNNFSHALKQAREYGYIGENILGSGFSFDVKITRGGGAFVCGESSALVASIEGKLGEPRDKYVRNTEQGLWGKPTVLNNVKTWASVPFIINQGAKWFTNIGTKDSTGTMVFSLTGKVNNTGLVEVPMGISLQSLVFDIGGGIKGDKKLKAVQTGGPSGGCIPENKIDIPLDYEKLTEIGSMMGSGGMIVMDESTCMVDVSKYFLNFTQEESCGKCIPCREGGRQLVEILNKITQGEGKEGDLVLIKEVSKTMQRGALCNLGRLAPNPVITTLKYFKNEYLSHIYDKHCPAGVCKDLISYSIIEEECRGCQKCIKSCPVDAISGVKKEPHSLDQEKCTKCGSCYEVCPFDAILVK